MREKAVSNVLGGFLIIVFVVLIVALAFPLLNSIVPVDDSSNAGSSSSLVTAIEETPSGIEVKTIQAGQGGEILVGGDSVETIPPHATGKTYKIENAKQGDTVSVKPNITNKIQSKYTVDCGVDEEKEERDAYIGGQANYQNSRKGDEVYVDGSDVSMTGHVMEKTGRKVQLSNGNETKSVELNDVYSRFESLATDYYCVYNNPSGSDSSKNKGETLDVKNPLIVLDTFNEWNSNVSYSGVRSRNKKVGNRNGDGFFAMDEESMTYSVYASKQISIPNASTRNDSEITTVGFMWQGLSESQEIRAGIYAEGGNSGKLIGASDDTPFIINGSNQNTSGVATFKTNATEFDVKNAKLVAVIKSDGLSSSPKLDKFVAASNQSKVSTNDTLSTGPSPLTVTTLDTKSQFKSSKYAAVNTEITTESGGNGRVQVIDGSKSGYYITVESNFTDLYGKKLLLDHVNVEYNASQNTDKASVITMADNNSGTQPSDYKYMNWSKFSGPTSGVTSDSKTLSNITVPVNHTRIAIANFNGNAYADVQKVELVAYPVGGGYAPTVRNLPRIAKITKTHHITIDTIEDWKKGNVSERSVLTARNTSIDGEPSVEALVYERGYETPEHHPIGGSYFPYKENDFEYGWSQIDQLDNGDFVAYESYKSIAFAEYIENSTGNVIWNKSINMSVNSDNNGMNDDTFNLFTDSNNDVIIAYENVGYTTSSYDAYNDTYNNTTHYRKYIDVYSTDGTLKHRYNLSEPVEVHEVTSSAIYYSHTTGTNDNPTRFAKLDRNTKTDDWSHTVSVSSVKSSVNYVEDKNKLFYIGRDTNSLDIKAGRIDTQTGVLEVSGHYIADRFYGGAAKINGNTLYYETRDDTLKKYSGIYSNSWSNEWSSGSLSRPIAFDGPYAYTNVEGPYATSEGNVKKFYASNGTVVWASNGSEKSHGFTVGEESVYYNKANSRGLLKVSKQNGSVLKEYPEHVKLLEVINTKRVYGILEYENSNYYYGWFNLTSTDSNNLKVRNGVQRFKYNLSNTPNMNITNFTITFVDGTIDNNVTGNPYDFGENFNMIFYSNSTEGAFNSINLSNAYDVYGIWSSDSSDPNLPESIDEYERGTKKYQVATTGCGQYLCVQNGNIEDKSFFNIRMRNKKLDDPVGIDKINITGKTVIRK